MFYPCLCLAFDNICTLAIIPTLEEDQPSIRRTIDQAQKAIIAELRAKEQEKAMQAIMDGKSGDDVSDTSC